MAEGRVIGIGESKTPPDVEGLHKDIATRINDFLEQGGDPSQAANLLSMLHTGLVTHFVVGQVSSVVQQVVDEKTEDTSE